MAFEVVEAVFVSFDDVDQAVHRVHQLRQALLILGKPLPATPGLA
jgi:hypothetical protein